MRQPKGLVYRAEYEPDMSRMVQALRILLEYQPQVDEEKNQEERANQECFAS